METRDTRIKRLRMRSMRRGIKEMDLILIDYSGRALDALDADALDTYEALLSENDQEIFAWILGTEPAPARYEALVADLRQGAEGLTKPGA